MSDLYYSNGRPKGPQMPRSGSLKSKKSVERTKREASYGKSPLIARFHSPKHDKITSRRDEQGGWAPLQASRHARDTVNPIRQICDRLSVAPNPAKAPIRLHLGDPTVAGNLRPSAAATRALHAAVDSHRHDGYGPAVGTAEARAAVARHFTRPEAPVSAEDVILASGASHALDLALVALADAGDQVLVPAPGFPLYQTLCRPHGIRARPYALRMDEGGLIDLAQLESLVEARTRAIVLNNPSNPTGVVFPRAHLEALLRLAERHRLVVVADEIYGELVYGGAVFHPLASLSPRVPIISVDGLAKRYLVPGWRLGWAIVHDRHGVLAEVRRGMAALAQKIVGPCALVQGALPRILADTPARDLERVREVVARNAHIVYEQLKFVPGLKPLRPQGAMYMMVGLDAQVLGDETPFLQGLVAEESVYCLPGSAFGLPHWFRLVLTYPEEVTMEACARIAAFCHRRLGPLDYHDVRRPRALEDGSEGSLSNDSD